MSDDVRAEVELVEQLWEQQMPTAPGHEKPVSLASIEQHQDSAPKTQQSVLPALSSAVTPVLLMRGVRKEFHLPQVRVHLTLNLQICMKYEEWRGGPLIFF